MSGLLQCKDVPAERLYDGRFLLLLIKGTSFCIRQAKVEINYALPETLVET
jgi:hypothetical protein